MTKHVALLSGGMSAEREVSLSSGKGVEKALRSLGYKVTHIDVSPNVAQELINAKPDVVFNALHGTYGEDGCIQGMLEIMGIPYTHSGVMASSIAMNKQQAKYIFEDAGILSPKGQVLTREQILNGEIPFKKPYVIKPVAEGSSVGVHIVKKGDKAPDKKSLEKYKEFLVEEYIPGKELSVAVLDDKPLGVIEIRPKDEFYDYKHKYTVGQSEHIMPAEVSKKIYKQAMETAFKAHKAIGCRGLSRCDFRYDYEGDGKLYLLEINTHPGLTPLSLAPEMAAYAGISFEQLVKYLVENAKCEK